MNRPLVILDIDSTLLHTRIAVPGDVIQYNEFPILLSDNLIRIVSPRPHLDRFLLQMFNRYRVAIWTAGTAEYADVISKTILTDEQRMSLVFLWDKEHCCRLTESHFIKPLAKVYQAGYGSPDNTIILDDNPISYVLDQHNAIEAIEYTNVIASTDIGLLIAANIIEERLG